MVAIAQISLAVLIRSGKGTNNIGNTNHLDGIDSISVDTINSTAKVASYEYEKDTF